VYQAGQIGFFQYLIQAILQTAAFIDCVGVDGNKLIAYSLPAKKPLFLLVF
jgi:hypothetical protein